MTAAIILTHNRHELLNKTEAAIESQVDHVLVIDNASNPPVSSYNEVMYVSTQPPNLAQFWNMGIEHLQDHEYIAFLCDDAIVPDGWFDAVVSAMVENGSIIGCSDPFNRKYSTIKLEPDGDIMHRLCGWAFVLKNVGLRADESMRWWWCDTDLDWQARKAGGLVIVGSHPVPNQLDNGFTNTKPELAHQAGLDGIVFAHKRGLS